VGLGQNNNQNTTPIDKERVVVCLHGIQTGVGLERGVLHREDSAARGQGCLRRPEAKEVD